MLKRNAVSFSSSFSRLLSVFARMWNSRCRHLSNICHAYGIPRRVRHSLTFVRLLHDNMDFQLSYGWRITCSTFSTHHIANCTRLLPSHRKLIPCLLKILQMRNTSRRTLALEWNGRDRHYQKRFEIPTVYSTFHFSIRPGNNTAITMKCLCLTNFALAQMNANAS